MMLRGVALAMLLAGTALHAIARPDTRELLLLPPVPGFHLLKADFHLHSVFSDGEVWPTVHVREAWRDGLDVVALSEHREYRPHARDVAGGALRAYELAAPLAAQLGVLLVPAVEITRPTPGEASPWPVGSAHFNALFVSDEEPLGARDLQEALQAARRQGAFVFWNHPGFMGRRAEWFAHVGAAFEAGLFDGIEVVNGNDYFPEAFGWALERRLAILACSDAHLPMPAHLTSRRRPVTILFAQSADLAGVREALLQRRTVAWLDDRLWGEARWLRALWEGAFPRPSRTTGRPGGALHIAVENATAIDFEIEIESRPSWLTVPAVRLSRSATTLVRAELSATAPPGTHTVELGVRVTNLHTSPADTLPARLRLDVVVGPSAP